MNIYQLKYNYEVSNPDGDYFSKDNMSFFGDSLNNYTVQSDVIDTTEEDNVEVWKLIRKEPVRDGLQRNAYFRKDTFKVVRSKEDLCLNG